MEFNAGKSKNIGMMTQAKMIGPFSKRMLLSMRRRTPRFKATTRT